MKTLRAAAFVIALIVFLMAFSSAFVKQPLFFAAISSDSMLPLIKRGDLVFSLPVVFRQPHIGDIVTFQKDTETWVVHRIVGGDPQTGFITKGDANPDVDQESGGFPRLSVIGVRSVVPTLAGQPLKIPLAGAVSLLLQPVSGNPWFVPSLAFIVAMALSFEPRHRIRRMVRRREERVPAVLVGALLTVGFAVVILTKSVIVPIDYEVVATEREAYVGHGRTGVTRHQELKHTINVQNTSFVPLVYSISSDVPEFVASEDWAVLWDGEKDVISVVLGTELLGVHSGDVRVGAFPPLLPAEWIHELALINFWLAVAAVSLVPMALMALLQLIARERRIRRVERRVVKRGLLGSFALGRW